MRMKMTPISIIRSTAAVGVCVRGCTYASWAGRSPSSAAAKKMRGAVIIEPFNVPNVLTAIAADTTTTPPGPITRRATSAATSSAPFICCIGIRYRYTRLAPRYRTTTIEVPMRRARGSVFCGRSTSPPTNARSAQPSYAQRIATIASRNGERPTAARCANMPPLGSPFELPRANPPTTSSASAATLSTVLRFCSTAPR